jgi:hypothetical protein
MMAGRRSGWWDFLVERIVSVGARADPLSDMPDDA